MRNLAYFEMDSIHYSALDGEVICNENIDVTATVRFKMDTLHGHLRWLIDNVEQTAFIDSLHWTTRLSTGKHTVLMIVKDEEGDVDSLLTSFVIQKEFVTICDTVCFGDSILFNGRYYSQAGLYTDTLQTVFGCDSIVTLNLFVNYPKDTTITASICKGKTYNLNGFNADKEGVYQSMFHQLGTDCDSLVTLILSVNPVHDTSFSHTICEGEVYGFYDKILSTSGTYTHTLINRYGCDSILELTLNVIPTTTTQIVVSICKDTSYFFAGGDLSLAGIYIDTLQSIYGCDSIIELTLSIDTSVSSDFEITKTGILCEDSKQVELTAMINNVDYQWNTGETSQSIRVFTAGVYSVEVSAGQCKASNEIELKCPCKIVLPNFFTPNGDGVNDVYIPEVNFEFESFSMIIFDRWGDVTYKTDKFIPWDGKQYGKDASAGVYFCVIEFYNKEYPAQKCITQSSVTLVR
jgi:gliding motility-associated-like protein